VRGKVSGSVRRSFAAMYSRAEAHTDGQVGQAAASYTRSARALLRLRLSAFGARVSVVAPLLSKLGALNGLP
jgi:hypothetical protein